LCVPYGHIIEYINYTGWTNGLAEVVARHRAFFTELYGALFGVQYFHISYLDDIPRPIWRRLDFIANGGEVYDL